MVLNDLGLNLLFEKVTTLLVVFERIKIFASVGESQINFIVDNG